MTMISAGFMQLLRAIKGGMPFAESTAARQARPCRTLRGVRVGRLVEARDVADAKVERLRRIRCSKAWARACGDRPTGRQWAWPMATHADPEDTFGEQFILIIDGHVRSIAAARPSG